MANTIFFSWQSDTPRELNKNFIKEALEGALKEIMDDLTVHEVLRGLEIDTDTKGVAGHPPIAETIFKKIDASSIFIADVTFVGKRADGRNTPNPNVLIEYGWALKSLGIERHVLVMNTAFGKPDGDNLPFDLRHLRWPIQFHLPPDSTKEKREKEKTQLMSALKEAIRACLVVVPLPIHAIPPIFPKAEHKDGPARFRAPGEPLGFKDDFAGDEPAMFS